MEGMEGYLEGYELIDHGSVTFAMRFNPSDEIHRLLAEQSPRRTFCNTLAGSTLRAEYSAIPTVTTNASGLAELTLHDIQMIEFIPEGFHEGSD
jgi:hypothetical protein